MSDLAEVGDFCPKDSCSDAGKTDSGNIIKYGRTSTAGPPRAFSATAARPVGRPSRKTPVRSSTGWHTPAKEIIETLALVAEGSRVASLSRVKGYKEKTIRNWLQQAAEHAEQVEDVLMRESDAGVRD